VLAARYFQSVPEDSSQARKYLFKAARLGHPEAQWKIGLAYYNASLDLQQDSEEALIWLSRAARSLLVLSREDGISSIPPLMSELSCRAILSQCSHIVGVIHLDGDATKQDSSMAIKWFQIAHQSGCAEAGKILYSLFRSGQY